ncbi:hypothetical protein [Moorena sp. SIO3H5]|uniref:hypothetical protein n=1 Tax=Moorena sp. SIO3H5 TaxID=2607834 RepID=UPI0013B82068|nr:hypothetical protein [Moorena sp. SIO3H5]NEO69809.1 hypothetical protein [Moorena sp. SIO3H5]
MQRGLGGFPHERLHQDIDFEKVRWGTPKPRSKTKYACGEETSIFPGSGLVKQVTPLKQESPSFQGGECQC